MKDARRYSFQPPESDDRAAHVVHFLSALYSDFVGSTPNRAVVGTQPVNGLTSHVACEKSVLEGIQLAGDVILPVKLVLVEHPQENVLGQNMLDQHLPDVVVRHVGANRLVAKFEEDPRRLLIPWIARLGFKNSFAKFLQDSRQVSLELMPRFPKLLDLRQFVVQKLSNQLVKGSRIGHVRPHHFLLVLEEYGGTRVLKKDVVAGIALA